MDTIFDDVVVNLLSYKDLEDLEGGHVGLGGFSGGEDDEP